MAVCIPKIRHGRKSWVSTRYLHFNRKTIMHANYGGNIENAISNGQVCGMPSLPFPSPSSSPPPKKTVRMHLLDILDTRLADFLCNRFWLMLIWLSKLSNLLSTWLTNFHANSQWVDVAYHKRSWLSIALCSRNDGLIGVDRDSVESIQYGKWMVCTHWFAWFRLGQFYYHITDSTLK